MVFEEKLRIEFPTFLEGDAWLFLIDGPHAWVLSLVLVVLLYLVSSRCLKYQKPVFFVGVTVMLAGCAALHHSDVSPEWQARHGAFAKEAVTVLGNPAIREVRTRSDVLALHAALRETYTTYTHLMALMPAAASEPTASAPEVQAPTIEESRHDREQDGNQ